VSISLRTTVVEMVYYQPQGAQPEAFESRYCLITAGEEGEEQHYKRQTTSTEQWRTLDTGWVKNPSTVIISFDKGEPKQVVPTDAEREEEEQKRLEIGFLLPGGYPDIPILSLSSGKSQRLHALVPIRIRSIGGKVRFTVVALP
jgi:hypothetical protein